MRKELIDEISMGNESITIEFKEARNKLPKNLYDTVCSFSNRQGGNIYLGVSDEGNITGVDPRAVAQMKKDFVTTTQSAQKIEPPLYLDIQEYQIEDKTILHIFVPSSSQVHRLNRTKIYDRNEDADIDITHNTIQVQQMYNRKQADYTERKIFSHVSMDDLRIDLIEQLRKTALAQEDYRAWTTFDYLEILKSLGMYSKDYTTGEEGFTLAAVITFGKDEVISAVLPYFRIDALVKKKDIERYDDRENIRTNLIESYSRLMSFIKKHTSDKFHLEGDQRINIRDILFRELIVNMLVHREYSNAFVSKITVYEDHLTFENANKPIHPGIITEGMIAPYPKNPTIARVFNILGLIDELGSGVNKIFKYTKIMYGSSPIISNQDIFKVQIDGQGDLDAVLNLLHLSDSQRALVHYLENGEAYTSKYLMQVVGLKDPVTFRKSVLNPLIELRLVNRTIPGKPTSPNQKYKINKEYF